MKILYAAVLFFAAGICFAEDPKVYTNDTLKQYDKEPMVEEDPSYKAKLEEYRRYNQQVDDEYKAEADRRKIEKEKAEQKQSQEQAVQPEEKKIQDDGDPGNIYLLPNVPRQRIRHY